MKKHLFLFALISLFFIGCAGVSPVFQAPEHKKSTSFDMGKEQIANVGEPMVIEEDIYFYNGMVARADYQLPAYWGATYPLIQEGTQFKIFGHLQNGDPVYKPMSTEKVKDLYGRPVVWDYCIAINAEKKAYGVTACHMSFVNKWPEPVDFLRESKIYQKDSFKMELIYNGKTRDTIKLTYREFNENLARPAFTQDLLYDLSEAKTIGFKGMKIDVLAATNSHIKFIVHSSMR